MAATGQASRSAGARAAPLPVASIQLRIVAFVLDCIVMFSFFLLFVAIGGFQLLTQGDNPPDSALYAALAIMGLFFFPFAPLFFALMWSWRGQSVGMMAVRIVVTDRAGQRPTFARALVRTLLWPLSLSLMGIGLFQMLIDGENRALHDVLSGTVVRELP